MKPRLYRKYTRELLEPLVKESTSVAQVIKRLGLKLTGGNQTNINDKIRLFELDTTHFKAQGWNKGLTKETSLSVAKGAKSSGYTDAEIFTNKLSFVGKRAVRKRFKELSKYQCSICDLLPTWNGKPLSLHLDHKNGNRTDNRKRNLRWVCPNCHQQTETWGNCKNRQ